MTVLTFVDTETTGLDPIRHEVWEIAVIRREEDGTETEHLWQIRQTDWHLRFVAEPKALEINRYHQRIAVPADAEAADMLNTNGDGTPTPMTYLDLAARLVKVLQGAVMIGSNPAFDAGFLHHFIRLASTPWHYRTIDVATLAAGYRHGLAASGAYGGDFLYPTDYPQLPYKSYKLSRQIGVEPPAEDVAHTALGDARWARDVFDAVTRGGQR